MVRLPVEVPPGRAEIIVIVAPTVPTAPRGGISGLVGLLRSDGAAPDDEEVARILDEAREGRAGR